MKPFNIQKARLGEIVVQRNGNEARYVGYLDQIETSWPLVFQTVVNGKWQMDTYTLGGELNEEHDPNDRDLFMASTSQQLWVQAYQRMDGSLAFISAETRDILAETSERTLHILKGRLIGKQIKIAEVEM